MASQVEDYELKSSVPPTEKHTPDHIVNEILDAEISDRRHLKVRVSVALIPKQLGPLLHNVNLFSFAFLSVD